MTRDDVRFHATRAAGLIRRALVSLRQRGARATLDRIAAYVRPRAAVHAPTLYAPSAAGPAAFALGTSVAPRVSIVIPVFNQVAYTLACLRALSEHPPATAHEVIVVDDASSDDTPAALAGVGGIRYHRRVANGGFIAACNEGAALARGDVLLFLNNDTVPQPGWLEALLATFDTHPRTGLAGAQLVYPDGRLQESGGLVFSDASGWNYGRSDSPDDPRYAFSRVTDYCSGAAIAIPRALFERVGGFDVRYAPAYYEDTDLAFAVREAGYEVRVQPASRVVHCEGVTSGTDVREGVKAYQVRNQRVFAEKWRTALAAQPAPGTPADRTAVRAGTTVLVIDAMLPDPTRDSGSLRLVNLMALLRREGCHVVFLPANLRADGDTAARLRAEGVEVWHAPYVGKIPAWLRRHGPRFDAVIACRHYVAREFLPLIRRHAPRARLVFDTVDLHYLRERRGAELQGDAAARRNAERTRRLELDVIARTDATLVVSTVERDLLTTDAPAANVEIVSNVHELQGSGLPWESRADLVFVGGFRHPPNVDAVVWFAREVFPRVLSRRPGIVFHCIGADAPDAILALARQPGIHVHGHVPDLSPFMDGARIAVAPLRYGAGVKGKVNLSMAHGQPVVATSCAVEGMHLRHDEDVLVADTPQDFADAILRLYDDATLWQRLAANGQANVERHFSMDAARGAVRRAVLGWPD